MRVIVLSFILSLASLILVGQNFTPRINFSAHTLCTNVFSLQDNSSVCFSYEEAMKQAEFENKSIVLFFSGYTCVKAKRMEEDLFCNAEISEFLLKNFILIELYTDDKTLLNKESGITKNRGERNSEIEIELSGFNRQPIIVLLSKSGEVLKTLNYTREKDLFWEFIK